MENPGCQFEATVLHRVRIMNSTGRLHNNVVFYSPGCKWSHENAFLSYTPKVLRFVLRCPTRLPTAHQRILIYFLSGKMKMKMKKSGMNDRF